MSSRLRVGIGLDFVKLSRRLGLEYDLSSKWSHPANFSHDQMLAQIPGCWLRFLDVSSDCQMSAQIARCCLRLPDVGSDS